MLDAFDVVRVPAPADEDQFDESLAFFGQFFDEGGKGGDLQRVVFLRTKLTDGENRLHFLMRSVASGE